jgi:hypothetical protein
MYLSPSKIINNFNLKYLVDKVGISANKPCARINEDQ